MIASIIVAALLALCAYIYFTVKERYKYFEKLGIPFVKPTFLVGSLWTSLSGRESVSVYVNRMYAEFPDEKLFGLFQGTQPVIILRDPDLFGTVLTKEFRNFSDRGIPYNEVSNPLEGHLFNISGQKWKILRSKLSPTFTSGKIKGMLLLMDKCVDVFIEDLERNLGKEVDVKNEFTKLSAHVIVLTDSVLTAQAAVFLVAGFETTSTALSFICYMLSKNNDAQEKLRKEIRTTKEKHNGFTYEALKDMHYLDAVINETLRLWSPVGNLIRKCMKTTTIAEGITIEQGIPVVIPTDGIQKDSKYYPDPLRFMPERFLDAPPDHHTFMPFGGGPRNCIGERFAGTELKIAVAKLLDKYRVDTCAKMASLEPVKFKVQALINVPNDGLFCVINKL